MEQHKINTLISTFFKDQRAKTHLQTQIRHINNYKPQLKIVLKQLYIYLNIKVINLNKQEHQACFVVIVSKSYPLKAPRVHLLNDIITPRINDTRDLLENILDKRWTYLQTLTNLFQKLEPFCQQLFKLQSRPLELQRTGKFYPGQIMPLQFIQQFPMQRFNITQTDKSEKKLLCLGELHILIFKINKNTVELELAAAIQSIHQICASKKGEVIIKIKKFKTLRDFNIITKKLMMVDAENQDQFVRLLLKRITPLQTLKISLQTKKDQTNDVINKQIKHIQMKQQELIKNPTSKDIINILNRLYQGMVDYYSLRGDYLYLIYVYKMNSLLKGNK